MVPEHYLQWTLSDNAEPDISFLRHDGGLSILLQRQLPSNTTLMGSASHLTCWFHNIHHITDGIKLPSYGWFVILVLLREWNNKCLPRFQRIGPHRQPFWILIKISKFEKTKQNTWTDSLKLQSAHTLSFCFHSSSNVLIPWSTQTDILSSSVNSLLRSTK